MKVYLVRHGKTIWNINNRIQGIKNIPLSSIGKEETYKLKEKTDKLNYNLCISSPLKRAKTTAKILTDNKCEILYDERIKERNMGLLEGLDVKNYDIKKYWDINYEKDDFQVESPKELLDRTKEFLKEIKEKYKDKTILIISHAGAIKALHFNIIGYNNDTDFLSFYSKHNEIYEYEI